MLAPAQSKEGPSGYSRQRRSYRKSESPRTVEPLDTYLKQIEEFDLLSREEEQQLAGKLQHAKKRLRLRMLSCQCVGTAVMDLLQGIHQGRLRLDRIVDVSVTNMQEKERVRSALIPTLRNLHRIMHRNRRYMRIAIANSVPASTRRRAWRKVVIGRYAAAALMESINLKTSTLRSLMPNIRTVARRMRFLQSQLLRARSEGSRCEHIKNLRSELLTLMLSQLDSPRTLARRIRVLEADELEFDTLRKQFASCNLRFVISTIKRYQHTGLAITDLIQEGNVGLLRAVEKFDPDVGCRFTTYADSWIRQEVIQAISKSKGSLTIPMSINRATRKIDIAREAIAQQFGRDPSIEEIADSMGVDSTRVRTVTQLSSPPISLNQELCSDGRLQLQDVVEIADQSHQLSEDHSRRLKHRMDEAMEVLKPREREILRQRFGFQDGGEKTLLEIGVGLGVSKERVRQLVQGAIEKLRQPICTSLLEDFLDECEVTPKRSSQGMAGKPKPK